MKFRPLLEQQGLTRTLFETINAHLAHKGLMLKEGTIVAAPRSTKNRDKARDPEMHLTGKGNQWHFRMKAHIGTNADSGLVYTDVTQAHALLHGQETDVFGATG